MAERKSLETMSGMILNRSQPRFAAKSVANEMRPVPGKGVCSDSNRTAQQLQMAARKSLETMSGMILNQLQPKFAKSIANENAMFESHVVTSVDRTSFDFQFEDFFSYLTW